MNGLVVRTMGFTGYARLNSNKDANNHSRSCGQGCESWPFGGVGGCTGAEATATGFQMAALPDSSNDPVLITRVPRKVTSHPVTVRFQTNQNKRKMPTLPSSLCTIQQSPPLTHTPPSNISKEKWVQCSIQHAPKSVT